LRLSTSELLRGACAMTRVTASSGSVSARANKYKLTKTASPLRGLQMLTTVRERERMQAAVVGRNMLITT
jgi:hypothetical protein